MFGYKGAVKTKVKDQYKKRSSKIGARLSVIEMNLMPKEFLRGVVTLFVSVTLFVGSPLVHAGWKDKLDEVAAIGSLLKDELDKDKDQEAKEEKEAAEEESIKAKKIEEERLNAEREAKEADKKAIEAEKRRSSVEAYVYGTRVKPLTKYFWLTKSNEYLSLDTVNLLVDYGAGGKLKGVKGAKVVCYDMFEEPVINHTFNAMAPVWDTAQEFEKAFKYGPVMLTPAPDDASYNYIKVQLPMYGAGAVLAEGGIESCTLKGGEKTLFK